MGQKTDFGPVAPRIPHFLPRTRPASGSGNLVSMRQRHLLLLAIPLIAVAGPALAEERIRVVIPSQSEDRVQRLIEKLTAAITDEDYATYTSCFTKPAKAKYCKNAVVAFVTYDLDMEIGKWFVTASTDTKTVFTIRYVLSRDGEEMEFVSDVECVPVNDILLIQREKPHSIKSLSASDPSTEYSLTCIGGQCQANGGNSRKKDRNAVHVTLGNEDAGNIQSLDDLDIFQGFPADISPCRQRKMMGLPCRQ